MSLFVNGVSQSVYDTGEGVGSVNVPSTTRNTHYVGMENGFPGTTAYLRLWHGSNLSSSEITSLYNNRNTISNSITDNNYWNGTDETYQGLTITEDSTTLNTDTNYEIAISSTGTTFNDITATGTTDVSGVVIVRFLKFSES